MLHRGGEDLSGAKEVAQLIRFLMHAYVRGIELLPDDDDDKRQQHGIQHRQPRINVAGYIMMRLEARVRHAGPHE